MVMRVEGREVQGSTMFLRVVLSKYGNGDNLFVYMFVDLLSRVSGRVILNSRLALPHPKKPGAPM